MGHTTLAADRRQNTVYTQNIISFLKTECIVEMGSRGGIEANSLDV